MGLTEIIGVQSNSPKGSTTATVRTRLWRSHAVKVQKSGYYCRLRKNRQYKSIDMANFALSRGARALL